MRIYNMKFKSLVVDFNLKEKISLTWRGIWGLQVGDYFIGVIRGAKK